MACVNPFEIFFAYVDNYIAQNPGTTLDDILNQVSVFPLATGICCNDCDDYPLIITGQNEDVTLRDLDQLIDLDLKKCCTKIYFSIDPYITFLQNMYPTDLEKIENGLNYKTCCNNSNFAECVENLEKYIDNKLFSEWLKPVSSATTGVFEFNQLEGHIGFCLLANALMQRPKDLAWEYLNTILQTGIVVKCTSTGVLIMNINQYLLGYPFP